MPPAPVLAAAAVAAGLYLGGAQAVHGIKKAAKAVVHLVHHPKSKAAPSK